MFVDGEFALGVSLTTLQNEQLYVGKPLTEEEYEQRVAEAKGTTRAAALVGMNALTR